MRVDEKIALLEKEARLQAKEEAMREQENEKNEQNQMPVYEVEQLRKEIRKGKVHVGFKTILFENREIMEGNLKIPYMRSFFDAVEEHEAIAYYVSDKHEIAMNLTMIMEKKKRQSLTEWKKFMKKEMLGNKLYINIKDGKSLEEMDYICYECPTGKGMLYNITFQMIKADRFFIGNFNCHNDRKDDMGVLLEAMVQEIHDNSRQ